jgi:VCBS repeat-containing protein
MLNVNVINAKNTQKVEVKPGQSANLKVDPNTRFELVDPVSGKAPTQIKARRVGDNLEIVTDEKAQIEDDAISNTQQPDLVLENYFKQADVSLFAGTGEEAVSYVPVDGIASGSYAAMNTSATTGAALGVLPFINPLLGAAVIGAGVVVARNSGPDNQLPIALDAASKVTENKVVSDKVPTATDADGTVVSYRLVDNVAAGKLTFNADGSYSFEANKDFDNLAEGQTRTVSFTYSAVDNAGGVSAPKTVTITVTGVNDAPIAIAATKAVDEGVKVAGSVAATDADAGATLKYALVGAAPIGLSFNADGRYSFDAADVAYDSLKAGETKDVVVKFKANDGTVDSAEQTLTITVKGTNDAATISGTAAGSMTEDAATTIATGSLSVSDADAGQSKAVAQTDSAGKFGKFSITEAGAWTYTLDNSKADVQALVAGQKVTETFKVESADGTASQNVVVTITGASDTAKIEGSSTGSVTEDAAATTATGSLSVSDADAGQAKVKAQADSAGKFGKFSITEAGAWTYTLDNSKADVQALVAGQKVTETFKVESADGTASQNVVVTITGASDTAKIEGSSTGSVTEDAAATTATGSLSVSDADAGQSKAVAQADSAGKFGKFSITEAGAWTYTLDNSKADVQALVAGQKVTETFKVESADGTASQNVVVTITGASDTAKIEGSSTGSVTEDAATTTATGSLSVSDADAGQAKVKAQADSAGKFGKFSITEAGEWTYELDNALIQSLPNGFFLEDKLTIKSMDGSASQEIVVTIHGADDQAKIMLVKDAKGEDLSTVKHAESVDAAAPSASGTLSVGMFDFNDEVVVSGVKFNAEKSSDLTGTGLTVSALEKGFIKALVLHPITDNGAVHNLAWDFYTNGTLPKDFHLVLDYTLQSLNAEEIDSNGKVIKFSLLDEKNLEVDVTGVNSPVIVSLQAKDVDAVTVTETNAQVESGTQTLTVNEWDFGDTVKVTVGSAKVNLEKSTFLKASDVPAAYEEYIQEWLHIGDFRDLSEASNLDWNFKTMEVDDLDPVPEGEKLVLDYVLNFYENGSATPVTTKTVEVTINGKNDAPTYELLEDVDGKDSSAATLNVSTNHFAKSQGTLSPYDPDFVETITHKITGLNFDAVNSTDGMKSKFDALNTTLKNLLTFDTLPTFNDSHSLTWKFNAKEEDLAQSLTGVQEGSVLAMDYVLRVTDVLGAFSEQKIHIELKV